jgi:DNA mismatch endonuclease (patch repair protein)
MDNVSINRRSQIMANVKSSGNISTELKTILIFRENHINGWRRHYKLIGNPDFTFPKNKIAVFIDGCFWHGCVKHCRVPVTNRMYWNNKIKRNIQRDLNIGRVLRVKGWKVIRIWEHELCGGAVLKRKINKLKNIKA